MATKAARGTKRTCQSPECGARFYDLNRDPIVCPICGAIYELAHAPEGAPIDLKDEPKKAKKMAADVADDEDTDDELEGADDIEDIDSDDDVDEASDDNDAFLDDDEEDDGDVSDIIPGSRSEKGEEG